LYHHHCQVPHLIICNLHLLILLTHLLLQIQELVPFQSILLLFLVNQFLVLLNFQVFSNQIDVRTLHQSAHFLHITHFNILFTVSSCHCFTQSDQ
jgi:hypothetical protein